MVTCFLLYMCLLGLCIFGELNVKYQYIILMYDPFVLKMYKTVPLTSNKWNSSQNFLRICFQGYNPLFNSKSPLVLLNLVVN